MTRKNDAATAGQSVPAELHNIELATPAPTKRRAPRVVFGVAVTVLLAALAFAQAPVPPLQIIPLAQGFNPENNVILHMKGATDVLQTDLIFQPGGTTGWHTHPGPVVVIINTGALTEIDKEGCRIVHAAKTAFFEPPNEVHNVINESGMVTDVYATFLSPTGAQPLIPAANPGRVCGDHRNGRDR